MRFLCWIVGSVAFESASADVFTPLASYEPAETDLNVFPNPSDTGLTVDIIPSEQGGAPAATDGNYLLRLDFSSEDGKIEFRHEWSATEYSLSGQEQLLADVFIATPSAMPGIMGVWEPTWDPPDAWQLAAGLPTQVGVWTTISVDVSVREQVGLQRIWAFIFENMPGADGTIYVDNLRLRNSQQAEPGDLAGIAFADRVELIWRVATDPNIDGYRVYRSQLAQGPFELLTESPVIAPRYTDPVADGSPLYYYYVTAVTDDQESAPSNTVSLLYNGYTDEQLLDITQLVTFWYFWNYGHPVSGMAREGIGFGHSSDTVTTGGTGMGLMAIMVGADRGFITRTEAADRVRLILAFLQESATRYHGVWSHHLHGVTGETIPFAGPQDNGGDLVETSFLLQGMLAVRQYFDDPAVLVEIEIRDRVTQMWEEVEWDWYRRFPGSDVLYWHWSPDFGFAINLPIRGYNEAMIPYILAIASPTHPMPASSYLNGWAGLAGYDNGNTYYGFRQWVGPPLGGPLFFTHYSFLGLDPRHKRDAFCNYFDNSRNISRIHQAYCIDNPSSFVGYNEWVWGLTASFDPFGYRAHSPTNDNGTITPTAALSAMPFTPQVSILTLRHLYDTYANQLWGEFGFLDAFHLGENWFAPGYLAIDQGPIVAMIENHRTGLCWEMFMANPEITPALLAAGWSFDGDYDNDGDADLADYALFAVCMNGPNGVAMPQSCSPERAAISDLDGDDDADLADFAVFTALPHAAW